MEAAPIPRDTGVSALVALERVVLPALRRPPCVVSFSGGRDSSLVLAVAARVARREQLPLPIPASLRFPAAPESREASWQERVVRHLDLPEWSRFEFFDELDLVGPVAADVVRRHGALYPPNVHLQVPLSKLARGGTLLTGWGGDDLFAWPWGRPWAVLSGRRRPTRRDVLRVAYLAAPARLRRWRALSIARKDALAWLRPRASSEVFARLAEHQRDLPRRWDRYLGWLARRRHIAMTRQSVRLVAEANGCAIDHPLLAPAFLAALARSGGRPGWADRTAALTALFSDLLPRDVLARTQKAWFDDAFWAEHSRRFAAEWDGTGVDEEIVDADRLREAWNAPERDMRCSLLLQSAWLASRRDERTAAIA